MQLRRLQVGHLVLGRAALSEKASIAAQIPTVPSPTHMGITKPIAPGSGGIVTGTLFATASFTAACCIKSGIIFIRLIVPSAGPGFLLVIVLHQKLCQLELLRKPRQLGDVGCNAPGTSNHTIHPLPQSFVASARSACRDKVQRVAPVQWTTVGPC